MTGRNTADPFSALIEAAVARGVETALTKVTAVNRMLSKPAAAKYMCVSVRTIEQWVVEKRLIPSRYNGSRPYFERSDLDRIIEEGKSGVS